MKQIKVKAMKSVQKLLEEKGFYEGKDGQIWYKGNNRMAWTSWKKLQEEFDLAKEAYGNGLLGIIDHLDLGIQFSK